MTISRKTYTATKKKRPGRPRKKTARKKTPAPDQVPADPAPDPRTRPGQVPPPPGIPPAPDQVPDQAPAPDQVQAPAPDPGIPPDQGTPGNQAPDPNQENKIPLGAFFPDGNFSIIPLAAIACKALGEPIQQEDRDALKMADVYLMKSITEDFGKVMAWSAVAGVFVPRILNFLGYDLKTLVTGPPAPPPPPAEPPDNKKEPVPVAA